MAGGHWLRPRAKGCGVCSRRLRLSADALSRKRRIWGFTMRLATAALLLILPVGLAAPALPAPNLLVNGSFEEGLDDIGPFKPLDKGSTAIKGWTVTRGQVDLIGTFWKSADGSRSIDLHGSPGYGGIAQTFKTKKGAKYRVEFQLATTPGAGARGVIVEAAGESKQFDVDDKDRTKENMKWTKTTWEFTATATETTLEIRTSEKGDNEQGPAIDDVVVREK